MAVDKRHRGRRRFAPLAAPLCTKWHRCTGKVWRTLNIGKSPRGLNKLIMSGAVHGQISEHVEQWFAKHDRCYGIVRLSCVLTTKTRHASLEKCVGGASALLQRIRGPIATAWWLQGPAAKTHSFESVLGSLERLCGEIYDCVWTSSYGGQAVHTGEAGQEAASSVSDTATNTAPNTGSTGQAVHTGEAGKEAASSVGNTGATDVEGTEPLQHGSFCVVMVVRSCYVDAALPPRLPHHRLLKTA